jgi:hypothetical protein
MTGIRVVRAGISAAALVVSQLAAADTIQLSGFWAGSGSATITFSGTNYHDGSFASFTASGGAGGFRTYNLTTDPARQNSFQSWCVDIFHSFSFPALGTAVSNGASVVFGAAKAADLGRLFTNFHSAIDSTASTGTNQAAFQLAIWEIVNETAGSYSLGSGDFRATGTGASVAASWLNQLNTNASLSSAFNVDIWSMLQGASGTGPQDVAVFTPIPEPQTYAMLLAGLGLMGFVARRRSRSVL